VADVNGNGKPDLVVAHSTGAVAVLLGKYDGTFRAAQDYGSGEQGTSVAVADVNGDGKADLVVTNLPGDVDVLLGNGDGTFQRAVIYDSGGVNTSSVAIADVNGDGKPDLLVANQCANVNSCNSGDGVLAVLFGNGDGTFQTPGIYDSGGAGANSVAVADVNGDGNLDLVVANQCGYPCPNQGLVGVLFGNGDGTFQAARTYDSGGIYAFSVAVADVNGDGKLDLVVANYCPAFGTCANGGAVGVLLGNGDGTFRPAATYGSGGESTGVAVADVNGDGIPDLVLSNLCSDCGTSLDGTVGVLVGNGDGTFQPVVTYDSGASLGNSIAVADVNGDGKPDLLVADSCVGSDPNNYCPYGIVGVLMNTSMASTTTALTSAPNPSRSGHPVTLMATVTSSKFFNFEPGATVTFFDGTSALGSRRVSNNVARLVTRKLAVGTHSIYAVYSGDKNFTGSTSNTVSQVVNGGP
jgi:hypothetical protein